MAVDQNILQQGLASAGLPPLPQLFQQQQQGIFGGGGAAQQIAAEAADPPGFLEKRFGTGKRQKARIQKQRVKDARALGDLARTQGIETGPALASGIANQLQSSFGPQGAAQLLAEKEKQLPVNVAEAERIRRQQRKETQQQGLQFAQETKNRQLEQQIKEQTLEKGKLDIEATELDQRFKQQTGFDNPADAVDTSLQIQSTNSALGSLDSMIKIREDMGAIGPIDFMSNPEAVAAVRDFQKFEATNLFKELANDTRLSDEDRKFYNSIIDLDVKDILFTGGKVELNQLKNMQARLESTMKTYEFGFPQLVERRPALFARKNFDDIGPAFTAEQPEFRQPEGSLAGGQGQEGGGIARLLGPLIAPRERPAQ